MGSQDACVAKGQVKERPQCGTAPSGSGAFWAVATLQYLGRGSPGLVEGCMVFRVPTWSKHRHHSCSLIPPGDTPRGSHIHPVSPLEYLSQSVPQGLGRTERTEARRLKRSHFNHPSKPHAHSLLPVQRGAKRGTQQPNSHWALPSFLLPVARTPGACPFSLHTLP